MIIVIIIVIVILNFMVQHTCLMAKGGLEADDLKCSEAFVKKSRKSKIERACERGQNLQSRTDSNQADGNQTDSQIHQSAMSRLFVCMPDS